MADGIKNYFGSTMEFVLKDWLSKTLGRWVSAARYLHLRQVALISSEIAKEIPLLHKMFCCCNLRFLLSSFMESAIVGTHKNRVS